MSLHDIVDYLCCLILLAVLALAVCTNSKVAETAVLVVEADVEAAVLVVEADVEADVPSIKDGVDWDYIDHAMVDSTCTLQRGILENAESLTRDDFGRCLHFIFEGEAIPWSFWNERDLAYAIDRHGPHYEPRRLFEIIKLCEAAGGYHVRYNFLNTYKYK